eukprot:13938916-Alexandrium_andersonii.AAC.1
MSASLVGSEMCIRDRNIDSMGRSFEWSSGRSSGRNSGWSSRRSSGRSSGATLGVRIPGGAAEGR